MKYEWKKNEKYLYGVKQKPKLIDVPSAYYIMIGRLRNLKYIKRIVKINSK